MAGRVCPLAYRYSASAVRAAANHVTDSAFVVGGLYGNSAALAAVLELADAEELATGSRPLLVFNGDFNWFNAAPPDLLGVNATIRNECGDGRAVATAGNVEVEMARAVPVPGSNRMDAVGCGCAYPAYIDDDVVRRSNALMERLRRSLRIAQPEELALEVTDWLRELPLYTRLSVGGLRVAVLHGDTNSLAGWSLAAEAVSPPDTALLASMGLHPPSHSSPEGHHQLTTEADVEAALESVGADVIACTHTCLPFAQAFHNGHSLVINNGSAGMPNFPLIEAAGNRGGGGMITRISTTPFEAASSNSGSNGDGRVVAAQRLYLNHPCPCLYPAR